MRDAVTLTGIVLSSAPSGEYDKRVVILTKERGKITAFARGARRQHSPMLASTQLFAFGVFRVYEGKNAYTLVSAEISNYFEDIPRDPLKACYGSYFLEMASYYARENNNEVELLKLVYQTLRMMCKGAISLALIRVIYELRMFVVNGEYPEVFQCRQCGAEEKLKYWGSVDCYTGGTEHITRHVLYAFFWQNFLYEIGAVPTRDPFIRKMGSG